jgi:hypothetical protein
VCEIARNFPKIRFLAFTKSYMVDYSRVPANLKFFWTIMPDTKMATVPKHGSRAYTGNCAGMRFAFE